MDSSVESEMTPCGSVCSFTQREHQLSEQRKGAKFARKLVGVILLSLAGMAVEIVGGKLGHSLAILTDASHLLSDILGFSFSLLALRVSAWDPTAEYSFGFHRVEVLGSLFNVASVWAVSGVLIAEACKKFFRRDVEAVKGVVMFATAALGFLTNLTTVLWLGHGHGHGHHHHHHRLQESRGQSQPENINVRGAYTHAITDLVQSVGVMIGAGFIWWKPHWAIIDPVCTLVFSALAVCATIRVLRDTLSILMERAPREVDVAALRRGLGDITGVRDVHDLHVWSITAGRSVLACHVVVEPGADPTVVIGGVRDFCLSMFDIHHTTIQIEH